jgi:carbamoylphosphate synthase large subunit
MYEKYLRKYKNQVKKNMKQLEVYKPEFDTLIEVYAGMLAQYMILSEKMIAGTFEIEVETTRGGTRKSAEATSYEKLRADIIIYSDRLMLNPRTIDNAKRKVMEKESSLIRAIRELSNDPSSS